MDSSEGFKLTDYQKLVLAFGSTFNTESGKKVLEEFERLTNTPSYEPGMPDPERAPYYYEGRRSILLLCKFMISQGEKIMDAIHIKDQGAIDKLAGQAVSILDESEES